MLAQKRRGDWKERKGKERGRCTREIEKERKRERETGGREKRGSPGRGRTRWYPARGARFLPPMEEEDSRLQREPRRNRGWNEVGSKREETPPKALLYLSYNYHNRASNHPSPPPALRFGHPGRPPPLTPTTLRSNSRNRKLQTREYIFPSLLSRSSRPKLFAVRCRSFHGMLTTPWKIIGIEALMFPWPGISCLLSTFIQRWTYRIIRFAFNALYLINVRNADCRFIL